MKILFFGDIVGKIGRTAIELTLPEFKKSHRSDLVIANIENTAHGKGITSKTFQQLVDSGIDVFTSGNHIWKKEDVESVSQNVGRQIITPANDPRTPTGQGWQIVEADNKKILIVNLLGRVFMDEENIACPFRTIDKILSEIPLRKKVDGIIVDFHAEATSEKVAMGWYLDGRVSAMIGTHTHIPTADSKILPQGTGYLTDLGMVGPVDSVLGVNKDIIIEKFLTDSPIVFKIPESGEMEINAVLVSLDPKTGLTKAIEKIQKNVYI